MKKLLMKLSIWYLNKCSVQPLEFCIGKCLMFGGEYYEISYFSTSESWESKKLCIEADRVLVGGRG